MQSRDHHCHIFDCYGTFGATVNNPQSKKQIVKGKGRALCDLFKVNDRSTEECLTVNPLLKFYCTYNHINGFKTVNAPERANNVR